MMASTTSKQWAEFIKTGAAEELFSTYSDDIVLANKINELFESSMPITPEQIRRDRQRYHNRPTLGDQVNEEEASPTKNVIRNKAQQLDVKQALAEIIDNIFDNYQRNEPHNLNVEIIAYPQTPAGPGEILITENSGGIDKKHLIPLIQLGLSERSVSGIGAWGEGFKMAVFALGEEVEVFSSYPNEQPIGIKFPKGWLDPSHHLWTKWKVNTYRIDKNPLPLGTTILKINYLHAQVLESLGLSGDDNSETVCRRLGDYIGEIYAEKYHNLKAQGYGNIKIKLTIGSATKEIVFKERVKVRLIQNISFVPWLKPIHWKLSWNAIIEDPSTDSKTRTAKLNVEIYAGIAYNFKYSLFHSRQDPGVEMWGNGRLFSLKGPITDESVGWGYKFGGSGGTNPESNASSRRLTIVALFTSDDPRNIPWAAPVKNDYNRRSEFYAEIRETLAKVIRLYKDGLRFLDSRLLPFSLEWSLIGETQKLDKLFENSDATSEFKSNFANSRFGKKLLSYDADTSFLELSGRDEEITVYKVFGMTTTTIQDIVNAASKTKQSADQVVEYLKALFPNLSAQAKLEEEMGLEFDEELEL